MMGLNDEVLDEVDDVPELVTDGDILIIPPKPNEVIDTNDNLTTIMSTLDGTKTKLKLVEDKKSVIVDLSDLEEHINNERVISKSEALAIEGYIPDFTDTIALNSFTEIPTRVNVDETISVIRDKISKEQDELRSMGSGIIATDIDKYLNFLNSTLVDDLPGIREVLTQLSTVSAPYIERLSKDKEIIAPISTDDGVEFIDILSLDITNGDLCKVMSDDDNIDKLLSVIADIKNVIGTSLLAKYVLHSANSNLPINLSTINDNVEYNTGYPITILIMLRAFHGTTMIDYVDTLDSTIDSIITDLEQLKETTDPDISILNDVMLRVRDIIEVLRILTYVPLLVSKLF